MRNWSKLFLERYGKTINNYPYRCYDLASEVREWLKTQKIRSTIRFIYPAGRGYPVLYSVPARIEWDYHAVITMDGIVHDAWCDKVLELREYVLYMFTGRRFLVSGTWRKDYRTREGLIIERPKLV